MKAMEGRIILALEFNLNKITPFQLLDTIADKWPKEAHSSRLNREAQRTVWMCKYLIELALF